MPVFIPDIFGAYIRGRQQAIQDNWHDLNQYNQVQAGQLQNAYTMATFDDDVRKNTAAADTTQLQNAAAGVMLDDTLRKRSLAQQNGLMDLSVQYARQNLVNNLLQQTQLYAQLNDPNTQAAQQQALKTTLYQLQAQQQQYQNLLNGGAAATATAANTQVPRATAPAPGPDPGAVYNPQQQRQRPTAEEINAAVNAALTGGTNAAPPQDGAAQSANGSDFDDPTYKKFTTKQPPVSGYSLPNSGGLM